MDNRLTNSVGSSRIRMRWLLPFWEEAEEYGIAKQYEILIFQKVYWGAMMDAFNGIKILDLCDPDWLENRPVFEFIDKVDAVTTSTEPLAEFVRKMRPNKLVKCIPDRVLLSEAPMLKKEHAKDLRKVAWFGYSGNAHYLIRTFDELIARDIEVTIISDSPIEAPSSYRGKLKVHNITYNEATLNKELLKADALLLPMPHGDERAKYKSDNKTLHGWALGLPVIRMPEDFDLLATKEAREQASVENRKTVEEKYDTKYSVDEYRELIEEIKKIKNETSNP